MTVQAIVRIDGASLAIEDVVDVARRGRFAALSDEARADVQASHDTAKRLVATGHRIYGLTTGAGALDRNTIPDHANRLHQLKLLRSHAAGTGSPAADDRVRATILVRANALAGGWSAVRPLVLDRMLELLAAGVVPEIPEAGSVGASDLAQLAHIGLALCGEGRAKVEGVWMSAREALARAGLVPLALQGREGFAIFNGVSYSAALGALVVHDADRLRDAFEQGAALGAAALRGLDSSFEARSVGARPHPGPVASAARLRELRPEAPSGLREHVSLRTAHQTLGALREAVARLRKVVTREINAPADNPAVAGDGWYNNNNANFDGTVLAQALDMVASAVLSAAVQSERRTARLLDEHHNNGLPAFLIHPDATPGVDTGMMLAQYTAASLIAEMRTFSAPASVQSLPTCANSEDWASMCALAARRAAWMVEQAETVAAIELLVSAQAADLRGDPIPAPLRPLYTRVRSTVPTWVEDRIVGEDIRLVTGLLRLDGEQSPNGGAAPRAQDTLQSPAPVARWLQSASSSASNAPQRRDHGREEEDQACRRSPEEGHQEGGCPEGVEESCSPEEGEEVGLFR